MGLRVPFVLSLIGPFLKLLCNCTDLISIHFYSDSVFMLYLYLNSCSLVIYAPNKSCYKNNNYQIIIIKKYVQPLESD